MRPLTTPAARAEAAAVAEERMRTLTARHVGALLPDAATLFRQDAWETVGLYEYDTEGDEVMIGCLRLHREPADSAHWGKDGDEPGLLLSLAHSLPAYTGTARLMTLWAADYTARLGKPWVRAEAPPLVSGRNTDRGRLIQHLGNLGWQAVRPGKGVDGMQVTRLRIPSQRRPGLAPLIDCQVPLSPGRPAADGSARTANFLAHGATSAPLPGGIA
ncbi:hypothetical protein [Streptomyces sp. UH6]|uniref:hypothetical protein n=1 Tax=Streptomyces sp. UH6 TaxID=2748379 RepID=UPI0015D498DD|nr:hypothetical protein [Streptomyces sp. UH6]NYV72812.1 hypothetical protein [Streptomyces sp. UH6]